jgi:hypothetical protein
VLVQTNAHERLVLPTTVPKALHADWEQDFRLEPAFNLVLGRIRILAECGPSSMMVLHNFLSKHIRPLQDRSRPAWLYTMVNDATWLKHDDSLNLDDTALASLLGKLSPDLSSHDLVTPRTPCQPLCLDQAMRVMLLVSMPLMDDIGIATIHRGDQS